MSNPEQTISYLKKIMIISTFGGLLFGYDTGVINGALPYMAQPDQLDLNPLHEGMVVSTLLIGAAIGSVCGGRIADLQGRKRNILSLSLIFFVAAIGCSLSPSFHVIMFFRFLLGLAVGGASVTVPAYLAEISPADKRGRMVTQNELMIVSGQFLAFICNAIIAVVLDGNPHIWRYMLAMAAIPAICLFVGIHQCPESPRWLVMRGQVSESLAVLQKIRSTKERAIAELNEIQDNLMEMAQQDSVRLSELTQGWVMRIIGIGIGIACLSQMTGINSIMFYGTQVLNQAGFSMQAAIIANTLNGLTSVLATIFGIWLMTKIPRRRILTIGFCGTTASLMMIAMTSKFMSDLVIFPYLVLLFTITFLAFMQGCIGPLLWLTLSEIVPLRYRGFGMGICILFDWITNFVIGLAFPSLLAYLGLESTFLIFGAIGLISITFTRLCMPETMGKTLEEIEREFHQYDTKVLHAPGKHCETNA